MRLFAYYAWHSFKNQLKKIFKTWVMIFILACMVFGGLLGGGIGIIAGIISDQTEEPVESSEAYPGAEDPTEAEEPEEPLIEISEELPFGLGEVEPAQIVEAATGLIVLMIFVLMTIRADKSAGKIFLPADVNLLFASPLTPQSVLLFRLMTKMGMSLFASIYLLFQLPNLVLNLGLKLGSALSLIGAWVLTLIVGQLLQLLCYVYGSTHPGFQKGLRRLVYTGLLILAGGFILYQKQSGLDFVPALAAFFCAPATRFIPFWGWIKGFAACGVAENWTGMLLFFGLLVVFGTALIWFIWHLRADYYEDALSKSEEIAEMLEQARAAQEGKGGIIRRKKDRSERLRRDGLKHGSGANVFFFKTLYNRFRFAQLGFLTKTMELYLFFGVLLAVLFRYALEIDLFLPIPLVFMLICFFRSLGNPLQEDTRMGYFVLIPETSYVKLLWSLAGGLANCFLDILPAMAAAVIILRADPLAALGWLIAIVSVDAYATSVGTFINLSVPVKAGAPVKSMVQVLFFYIGLIPDVLIVGLCLFLQMPLLAVLLVTLVNLGLAALFMLFAALAMGM